MTRCLLATYPYVKRKMCFQSSDSGGGRGRETLVTGWDRQLLGILHIGHRS